MTTGTLHAYGIMQHMIRLFGVGCPDIKEITQARTVSRIQHFPLDEFDVRAG